MASSVFDIKQHIIPASHIREYARATAKSQDEPLLLHVKQYIPKSNGAPRKGDLTIIGSHGNGFPKELYEPLWEDLIENLEKKSVRVSSIWIADCAWQGQSGILNKENLGNDPSWFDYSRDIVQLINHFRMPRPLLGIGHSFGACAVTQVALFHPRLFSALVLVDPVIATYHPDFAQANLTAPLMSSKRRDVWPSRQEAAAAFRKSGFYKSWNPRVLDRWVEHGLVQCKPGSPEVTLATTKHQEVFTFSRPSFHAVGKDGTSITNVDLVPDMDTRNGLLLPAYRPEPGIVFDNLPYLRPWTLWVFGGMSNMSPEFQREAKLSRTGISTVGNGGVATGRVSSVVGEKWTHSIPFEAPSFVAHAAADYAEATVKRWQDEDHEYQAWTKKPLTEKSQLSKDLLTEMAKAVEAKL